MSRGTGDSEPPLLGNGVKVDTFRLPTSRGAT